MFGTFLLLVVASLACTLGMLYVAVRFIKWAWHRK